MSQTSSLRDMIRDQRAVAMVEFAYVLPLLILIIFYGLELANYAITREQISELAMQIADNSSRIGAQDTLSNKPISEAEINDTFIGGNLQGGWLDIQKNGRIILSSLEQNADGGQWIHWQRCFGSKAFASSYGIEGDGAAGKGFVGMGPPTSRITAEKGMGVMFVEVAYDYKPLISSYWAPGTEIKSVSAFNVRDDRDLKKVYNPEGVKVSTC